MKVVVVGSGIVGLASAYQLRKARPHWQVVVVEKESRMAAHQTGRNSGVLHSGIYYPPGSLKAETCLRGRQLMESFCDQMRIPWRRCGKVIVATEVGQLEGLAKLEQRGLQHGLRVCRLTRQGLSEIEPACVGLESLWVAETGVVNYSQVCQALAQDLDLRLGRRLVQVEPGFRLHLETLGKEKEILECDAWINCSGLYSDRLGGATGEVQIIPFRGEYYSLTPDARSLCQTLIYPVPDPRFPFLGVHLTRHIDDTVGAGPNAVLALGRENYDGWSVHWAESWETLAFPGFQKLALRYWKMGLQEQLRSWSSWLFLRSLQQLVPALRSHHLRRSGAGIRAQAVTREGRLVDDFVFSGGPRVVHVVNAPSPAATASLAIGETISQRLLESLD